MPRSMEELSLARLSAAANGTTKGHPSSRHGAGAKLVFNASLTGVYFIQRRANSARSHSIYPPPRPTPSQAPRTLIPAKPKLPFRPLQARVPGNGYVVKLLGRLTNAEKRPAAGSLPPLAPRPSSRPGGRTGANYRRHLARGPNL